MSISTKSPNSVEDAIDEVIGFYNVYHSMRYVKDRLVLRLVERLSDEKLDAINADFADILASGQYVQCDALPEEAGEPDLAKLPRLHFHFNRRALGRLRMLIDFINGRAKKN